MLFKSFLSSEDLIQRRKIYTSTKALFFLGTPHRGSDWALWGEIATGLAGIIFDTNSALIKHLEVNGETLMQLEDDFDTLLHKRTFLTKTFKEGRNFKPLPLLRSKVCLGLLKTFSCGD